MGILRSMSNAINYNGFDYISVDHPSIFKNITHLIIPGVGNFNAAIAELSRINLSEAIINFAISGRPILGVCLGMQLLMESGEEGGCISGLGLIKGTVTNLAPKGDLRLPHVGWNSVNVLKPHPVFAGIKTMRDYYFVHSYKINSINDDDIYAITDYGGSFTSVVGYKNIIGVQFHPEKSQSNGLQLIENFCLWNGKC